MIASLGRIWAIALNTFREAARIKILYGLIVVVVGINLLSVILGEMSVHEEARVAQDLGVAATSACGSLTAIVVGVFLLYTEIQRRTIHSIVSKPIERWEFVVGKYVGMAMVPSALVAMFALTLVATLAWRGAPVTAAIAQALVLAWFETVVVAAVAIFFSSFSSPFLSGIFALAIWVIGRLTPDIEAASRTASPAIQWTAKLALLIVPDMHLFAPSGSEVDGAHATIHDAFVSWSYVGLAGVHAAGWIAGLLALACLLFRRRDFV